MTYQIFDTEVGLLISPRTEIREFFPEDEPRITYRLVIVSEIEAEAKLVIHHYRLPKESSEVVANLSKLRGIIAIFDASSQSSFLEISKFLDQEAHSLQGLHIVLIGVDTKNAAIDFKMDAFASFVTYAKVSTRKELDRTMREFGSRLIHTFRSEEDA